MTGRPHRVTRRGGERARGAVGPSGAFGGREARGRGQDERVRRDGRHRVAGGAEPARRPELHVDHDRAGHPPLGHHQDPRAPPAPRRRRHHGGDRRPDRGVAPRVQPAPLEQGARARRRPQRVRRSPRRDALGGACRSAVEDIARIEVVRGPGSALYGADAFNGVINIITKAPGEGGSGVTGGYGDHNAAHGSLWATGPRKATSRSALSAGYDYLPRWSREVPDGQRIVRTCVGDQDQVSSSTIRLDLAASRRSSART